jgi:hypothetical protein
MVKALNVPNIIDKICLQGTIEVLFIRYVYVFQAVAGIKDHTRGDIRPGFPQGTTESQHIPQHAFPIIYTRCFLHLFNCLLFSNHSRWFW